MNPSENPTDRLLDSLLQEQHRNAPDEALLHDIENAIAAAPALPNSDQVPASEAADGLGQNARATGGPGILPETSAAKRRRSYGKPIAIAAVLALSATAVMTLKPGGLVVMRKQGAASTANQERLQVDYPPELIEGTPRAIVLPGSTPAARSVPAADRSLEKPVVASDSSPKPSALVPRAELTIQPKDSSNGLESPASKPAASVPAEAELAQVAKAKAELNEINKFKGALDAVSSDEEKQRVAELEGIIYRARIAEIRKIIDQAKPQPTPPASAFNRDQYGRLTDQPWKSPWNDALSTFSIDVDAASYTNVRNMILTGRPVPPDAVRIEECINYFDYRYAGPTDAAPFALHGTLATCPWQPTHLLARVAIKGREIENHARPASNLVFLIDVSGSMQDPLKLPLLKRSLRVLLDQLDERDHLGIVVYAGSEGVVLQPTTLDERGLSQAIAALEKLSAGGSTNGGAGLKLAYAMASQNVVKGGVNRVVLATDGDFNVGTTGQGDLVSLVKAEAAKGVSLSVLGFGTGNLNDAMLEAITNDGNGNYYYIDGEEEARRVFQQKLTGTLVTIAKDVKIQVEFNPGKVKAYRLIGYANRILRHEDFNNDKVDAGDIGAGHTVTAFYEIVPQGVNAPETGVVDDLRYQRPANREVVVSDEWFTLKLRHKHPEGDVSALIETVMKGEPQPWAQADTDFHFAAAVALFGMKLRQMPDAADIPWSKVEELAKPGLTDDRHEQRAAFLEMLKRLR